MSAQALLSADDPAGEWVGRLQRRGHLLELNPTALPYPADAVRAAVDALDGAGLSTVERRWVRALRARLASYAGAENRVWAEGGLGLNATNNERLDPLRWTDAEEAVLQAGPLNLYPNGVARVGLSAGPAAAQFSVRMDVFYEDDPDGLDVVNQSIYLRNQESYARLQAPFGSVSAGAYSRQWGVRGEPALFVSDNARPFDAVDVRLGGERISIRAVAAELDAATLDGQFTGRTGDQSREPSLRRFLTAHRVDWRPRPWLTVAVVETMLYSGVNASPSLAALVPTSVLSLLNDGAPRNNENNSLVGGLFWVHRGRTTVHGQMLLDDIDLFNAAEPASVAVAGGATWAGPTADLGVSGSLVTARAYGSAIPGQAYVYARRGLGTAFSDYVSARVFADVYLDRPGLDLTVSPEVSVLMQGAGGFLQPYPDNSLPTLGLGDPERTVRVGARLDLRPAPFAWIRADLGLNRTWNDGNVRDREATRVVGWVEAGARFRVGMRP